MGSCWKRLTHSEVKSKRSKMPIVKFVYFDAQAKGELARLLLAAGNIDYEDIWTKLPKMEFAKSQAEREELAKEFLNEFMPKWLKPLEQILAKRGNGWFAGNGCTFADLAIMCALDWVHEPLEMSFKDMNNIDERKKILNDYPLLKANYQRTNE